jgi:hypothetical protein
VLAHKKKEIDAKALMVIGSLCPISVEGVIRGLRWGIGPRAKALSSHHIWTFIPPVGQNHMYGLTYRDTYIQTHVQTHIQTYVQTDVWTDRRTYAQTYGMNVYMTFTCDRLNSKKWPHPRALKPLDGAQTGLPASSEARLLTDNDTPFNI